MQSLLTRSRLWHVCLAWLLSCAALAADLDHHKIFGRVEHVIITDHGIELTAKLDTGAQTSSLSATDIQAFKKDGKEWIRFTIDPSRTEKLYHLELPLERYIKIRKRHGEMDDEETKNKQEAFERRPVVSIPVCLGNALKMVDVSLTNRSHFNYPMLLGRKAMHSFDVLIDPDLSFTVKPTCQGKSS